MNTAAAWKFRSKGNIQARYISNTAVILHQNGRYPIIGRGTWIGHFTILDGSQGLTIGKNCSIASGVHIYTHSTHEQVAFAKKKLIGSVTIGDNVVIGANSIVHYGCEIGDNTVIGSLSMLKPETKVGKGETWFGIPACKADSQSRTSDCIISS